MPLLLKVTAPVSVLFCVSVMALLPAIKFEVPATAKAPVCVMAPLAVALREPVKVRAGRAMPAALKFSVKLRKLVSEVKFVGKFAETLLLLKLKS